jgi:hypothetical protein
MALQLQWVGLAGWLMKQDDGPDIAMDPYEPQIVADACGVDDVGVFDFRIKADTALVSSVTDRAHCFVKAVQGDPQVINALDVAQGKISPKINGEPIFAVQAAEAPHHPEGPDDNALYAFKADGLWFVHMGDLGYGIGPAELAPFDGHCDVLMALVGENLTLTLDALEPMIKFLNPTWILPMHYNLPPLSAGMTKVDEFLRRRSRDPVVHVRHHTVTFPLPRLSNEWPTIVVLEPSGYEPSERY